MSTGVDILMVMLSPAKGGLEQSLLDYGEALCSKGRGVAALVHPDWPGRVKLQGHGIEVRNFNPLTEWDPLSRHRLRRMIEKADPGLLLTIGRRASKLTRSAVKGLAIPHIARTPNYSLSHLIGLDHIIASTRDIRRALIEAGQPEQAITVIPNMVRVAPSPVQGPGGEVPVVGALGRMVPKKGFADLVEALAFLKKRGVRFAARLGGTGEEEADLKQLIATRGLGDEIVLTGWIEDKTAFFKEIDVFCLPSRHEPFGIALLEAMAHGKPIVATDTEGPSEILNDQSSGLLVPKKNPEALADGLEFLLWDRSKREALARAGHASAKRSYDLPVIATRLLATVEAVIGENHAARHVKGG